jgi:muramoyltetrapeptide carboxypeptidase
VMSPSSYIEEIDVQAGVSYLENRGYKVFVHPQTTARHNQSAGTNTEKLNAFHNLIKNPKIKAIIFSTGGNRALNWVDNIDWNLVKSNPKIMMGFSDITPILNLVTAKTGLVTYHGPNLRWFVASNYNATDAEQCFDMLLGKSHNLSFLRKQESSPSVRRDDNRGEKGQLIGGNLPNFQYLINDIDFNDKILFLEDWNEEYSRLDRVLCNMKRQGVFEKINALILGQFENMLDTGRPYGFSLTDMIAEHVPTDTPVIWNAPFGHGARLCTLPIGQTVEIETNNTGVVLHFR